jgi:hypothetical protein
LFRLRRYRPLLAPTGCEERSGNPNTQDMSHSLLVAGGRPGLCVRRSICAPARVRPCSPGGEAQKTTKRRPG